MKDRIRTLMSVHGLNQSQFADKTGIHASTLNQMLNYPERQVKNSYIEKILAAFPEINGDWLIAGDEPMYKSELCSTDAGSLFSAEDAKNSADAKEIGVKRPATSSETTVHQPFIIKNTVNKKIERIVVYYTDKTYEEFYPSQKD